VAALESRIAELQLELSAREAQAREEGRREGEAAARQQLEAPLREAMARLAPQIGELPDFRKKLRREAEQDLVKLAVAIAHRVLRRELTTDPEAILGLVKAALERVEAREVFRVRVHPEDARILEPCFADLGLPEKIEVAADRDLERGGVILETSRGQLDASVETQLQEIERGFADLVRRAS
jgi:flagellar assembly protein FliH